MPDSPRQWTHKIEVCSACRTPVTRNFRDRWECPTHGDKITIALLAIVEQSRLREVEAERDMAREEIKHQNGWAHDNLRRAERLEADLREALAVIDDLYDRRDDYPTELTRNPRSWYEAWERARFVLSKADPARREKRHD